MTRSFEGFPRITANPRVQVRAKRTSAGRYASLVLKALEQTRFELGRGALVTVDFERVRVRLLTYPSYEQ
jgi:hypothetical protein